MPAISINTPREKQGYGVDSSDIFWCKHGILFANELAKSDDEQIVSDIVISILNKQPLNSSREVFDSYFDTNSEEYAHINASVISYGRERIAAEIQCVLGAIRQCFEAEKFYSFRNCVQEKPGNTARVSFFAVFMAFHNLIFKDGKLPDNPTEIRNALNNLQGSLKRAAHHTTTEERIWNIQVVTGLIQPFFVKKDVATLGNAHGLVVDLENSLRRSKYEASRYEFKLGICILDSNPKVDPSIFSKLARTACAIANTNPREDGFIYLGVADKQSAVDRLHELFETNSLPIGPVYFCGVGHDLTILGRDMDTYIRDLISAISREPVGEPLRTHLISSIDHAEYSSRPFVRIRVPAQAELTDFNGDFPIRKNSDTVNMTPGETLAQSKLFASR